MAKLPRPFEEGWIWFSSARKGNEGKGLLIHASDVFALHEGSEPGTTLIEFDPMHDRASELVYRSFQSLANDYADAWDARGRKPRKRKGPAEADPKVIAFKRA